MDSRPDVTDPGGGRRATPNDRSPEWRQYGENGQGPDGHKDAPTHRIAFLRKFEAGVVVAVGVLLGIAVAVAVGVLYVLIIDDFRTDLSTLESVSALQLALQNVFGGVLLVLLGLELIDTLKIYFVDHHIRTEVILVVAMIAIGRHIIQIDFEHTGGLELVGMAALTVALAVSYFLVKKARSDAERSTLLGMAPWRRAEGEVGQRRPRRDGAADGDD